MYSEASVVSVIEDSIISPSFRCECALGYRLGVDGTTCEDIDECTMANAGCSHTCINTKGSFVCTYVGYIDPFVFLVLQKLYFSSTVVFLCITVV